MEIASSIDQGESNNLIDSDKNKIVRHLCARAAAAKGELFVFLDEMPIDENDQNEATLICEKLSHLIHEIKLLRPELKIRFLIASLKAPELNSRLSTGKFAENFHVINTPQWSTFDLSRMQQLLVSALIKITGNEGPHDLPTKVAVNPRELKNFLRDNLLNKEAHYG